MQFVPKLKHDIEMFELYGNLHGPGNVKNSTLRMMKSKKDLEMKKGKVNKKLLALSQGKSVRNIDTGSSNSGTSSVNTITSKSMNKRKSVKDLNLAKEVLKSPNNNNNNTSQPQSPKEVEEEEDNKSFLAQLGKSMKNITEIMKNDNDNNSKIPSSSTATTPVQSPRAIPSKSVSSKQLAASKSSKTLTQSRSKMNIGNINDDNEEGKKDNDDENNDDDDGVLTPKQLKYRKWLKKILWCIYIYIFIYKIVYIWICTTSLFIPFFTVLFGTFTCSTFYEEIENEDSDNSTIMYHTYKGVKSAPKLEVYI